MNEAEERFRRLMLERGAKVLRSGWPDFLVITAAGSALAVEVKSDGDRMRPAQVRTFEALEAAGLEIRVWWARRPESLMRWREFLRITTDGRNRSGSCGVGERIKAAVGAFIHPDKR